MDLVEFLLARLDEDEQAAQAASYRTPHWAAGDGSDGGVDEVFRHVGLTGPNRCSEHPEGAPNMCDDVRILTIDEDFVMEDGLDAAYTAHIARHDPARVRADVAAKRLILADHPNLNADWGPPDDEYSLQPICTRCEDRKRHDALAWPCPTLRAIGLPYADHSDYQPEWKP